MKNIKYFLFAVLFLFSNVFYVYASCTEKEIDELKQLADEIKISYRHLGMVEYEEGRIEYSEFEVKVKNLNDNLYISLFDDSVKMLPTDGIATEVFSSGTWNFEVYSTKCEVKIDEIKVFLPTFNVYSLDPLCEGIDGDDFPLCGKYYEYDVNYDDFKERVKHYRTTYNINDENVDENNNVDFKVLFDKIVNFIIDYKFYFIGGLVVIIITIIMLLIIKKKKKRGVLE